MKIEQGASVPARLKVFVNQDERHDKHEREHIDTQFVQEDSLRTGPSRNLVLTSKISPFATEIFPPSEI